MRRDLEQGHDDRVAGHGAADPHWTRDRRERMAVAGWREGRRYCPNILHVGERAAHFESELVAGSHFERRRRRGIDIEQVPLLVRGRHAVSLLSYHLSATEDTSATYGAL